MVDKKLKEYIEDNIFSKYKKFYAHGLMHIEKVIEDMLMLAKFYNLDENMAYVIACYHDAGLGVNRENHEVESSKILMADKTLKKFFTQEQLDVMKDAIEDHRGSKRQRPRNFYGECISDADRDFDIAMLAKRQFNTSIKNYPMLSGFEEHFERCYNYICGRLNDGGKFNLWTNNPILLGRRDKFQKAYLNKEDTKMIYKKEWDKITQDGTFEKIINFYEDF